LSDHIQPMPFECDPHSISVANLFFENLELKATVPRGTGSRVIVQRCPVPEGYHTDRCRTWVYRTEGYRTEGNRTEGYRNEGTVLGATTLRATVLRAIVQRATVMR
jgi:hypothetical protein